MTLVALLYLLGALASHLLHYIIYKCESMVCSDRCSNCKLLQAVEVKVNLPAFAHRAIFNSYSTSLKNKLNATYFRVIHCSKINSIKQIKRCFTSGSSTFWNCLIICLKAEFPLVTETSIFFFFSKYWRLSVGLVGINRFVFQTVSNHGEDIIIMVPKHLSFPAAGTSRAWWRPADHESSHCLSAVQNTRALLTRGRPTCKMEKPKRKHLNTVKKQDKKQKKTELLASVSSHFFWMESVMWDICSSAI